MDTCGGRVFGDSRRTQTVPELSVRMLRNDARTMRCRVRMYKESRLLHDYKLSVGDKVALQRVSNSSAFLVASSKPLAR